MTTKEAMALQTLAVRKRNGFAAARYAGATNGYQYRLGVHVVCSGYVPLRER